MERHVHVRAETCACACGDMCACASVHRLREQVWDRLLHARMQVLDERLQRLPCKLLVHPRLLIHVDLLHRSARFPAINWDDEGCGGADGSRESGGGVERRALE